MDLLSSLGLGNALPEQSTRLTSHPGIIKALNNTDDDDDVRLGFNACLHCGSKLVLKKDVSCMGCKRVKYCSTSCRKADSEEDNTTTTSSLYPEDDAACGHSPVICALLNLCNDDEDAEEEYYSKNNNDLKAVVAPPTTDQKKKKKEAATYRIQTELESYPATLFNILSEGPDWFVEAMTRRLRFRQDVRSPEKKQRRGKRDREQASSTTSSRELVLHIVGASVHSELWGWQGGKTKTTNEEEGVPVLNAYAEAASNLTSYLQNLLEISSISIRCVFVGPDCPKVSTSVKVPIPSDGSSKKSSLSTLIFETHCCNYGDTTTSKKQYSSSPDAIIFFNPGFSCMDYDWSKALLAASSSSASSSSSITGPTPFLITTNTEMEGYADTKYLLDGGYINAQSLPHHILEAIGDHTNTTTGKEDQEEEDEATFFFFGENPYSGMRVRQSGTMGNDLYVKNRWIVGGLFQQQQQQQQERSAVVSKEGHAIEKAKKKQQQQLNDDGDGGGGKETKRKRHRSSSSGDTGTGGGHGSNKNTKKKNPALI
ncbi:hypothetical protein ACHAXR_006028 [Thalassiosira sp. AJA248-18]